MHKYVHGSCGYVAKRSSGYLEVVDMERLASDADPTASANLSPGEIFSVTSLKDSIRCVMWRLGEERDVFV